MNDMNVSLADLITENPHKPETEDVSIMDEVFIEPVVEENTETYNKVNEVNINDKIEENEKTITQNIYKFRFIGFSEWIDRNKSYFQGVKRITNSDRGIDGIKNLLLAIPKNSNEWEPYLFKKADRMMIPDLECVDLKFFSNGSIRTTNVLLYNDIKYFVFSYITKLSSTHIITQNINNCYCPIEIIKDSNIKKTKECDIELKAFENLNEKINTKINYDDILLLYPQIRKFNGKKETLEDITLYLFNNFIDIIDPIHEIKIWNILKAFYSI